MPRGTSTGPGSAGRSPNAPAHRKDQATTGNQDYRPPIRIDNGSIVIDLGDGLGVDGSNRLTLDFPPLLDASLEVVGRKLRVRPARGVRTHFQDTITAGATYDDTELQATMDKLDALIESLRIASLIDPS